MISILSPITSDKITQITVQPVFTKLNSCPPFIFERCLRITLISSIEAPADISILIIRCLSPIVIPLEGKGISAEPPPDNKMNTKSDCPVFFNISMIFLVPTTPASSGVGWFA